MAFAEREFELATPQADGATLREHLENAAAQGVRNELLDGDPCPDVLAHVWRWFGELSSARGSSGFGPNPLGFAEISAWSQLLDRTPSAVEIELILRLDRQFLQTFSKRSA